MVPSPTRESPRIREEEEIGAGSDSDLRAEDDDVTSGVGLFECVSEGEKRSVALRLFVGTEAIDCSLLCKVGEATCDSQPDYRSAKILSLSMYRSAQMTACLNDGLLV